MTNATLGNEPRQGYTQSARPSAQRIHTFLAKTVSLFETMREAKDYTPNNTRLHAQLADYQSDIRQKRPDAETVAILNNHIILDHRYELTQRYAEVTRATKIYHASAKTINPIINSLLGHDYDLQISNELAQLPLRQKPMKDKDKLMFMGAGALPIGAVKMCLRMGRNGTCISDDEEEVYWGRKSLAATGHDKIVSYHLVEYRSGWAYEKHPLLIACNTSLDNFEAFRNNSEARWAEEGVVRDSTGLNTILRKTFKVSMARDLRIVFRQSAPSVPGSMEVSRLVSLIQSPESVAKPGLGSGPEGYAFYLDKMQKDNMRPENGSQYLASSHFRPN